MAIYKLRKTNLHVSAYIRLTNPIQFGMPVVSWDLTNIRNE